ncbi:FAD-dependent monooxygenase [Actinokineospora sp. G85]|uniref:FAD-dependent monooxygenase n=1 Tax=Actinokineospora sp. G85 TaxID=3406626 RepID=UPI003C795318
MRTVLISGASVAGPALAYWLHHHDFAVTIVERAPAPRPGGQAIDVRGVALEVLERTGVLDQARAARTRMRGMSMVDGQGVELWRSTEMALSSGKLDSDDIELLRDDLTRLLYAQTRDSTEYVFNDSITALDETSKGVRVAFERGEPRTFDLVIGADGLHSTVRRLAFGPEERFLRHLGTHLGVFSAKNFLDLDNWQVWFRDETTGGAIYPVRDNTELRVTLGFEAEPLDYDHRDVAQQKRIMTDRFAGSGWEIPRLIDAMNAAPDFYFDSMAQIHLDTWTTDRIALTGDAAYCASPLSGQGTSLALAGAYVLADELSKNNDDALARYEERLRPFVHLNQALATENPGMPPAEESLERAKNALTLDE